MTHCEYSVTYEDFLAAVRAYRRLVRRAAVGYWLYVWILPVAGVLLAVLVLPPYLRSDASDLGAEFWVAVIALGVAWGLPVRYRMGLKRAYRQRGVLLKDRMMVCEFDDKIVRFIVPGGTEISYRWEAFTDYFENDRVSVLFVKDAAFHTIPKRAMDESGWTQFRAIVHHHAGIKSC